MSLFTDYSIKVCLNGHIMSVSEVGRFLATKTGGKFCEKCGADIIDKCTKCNTDIFGIYDDEFKYPDCRPPIVCSNCGQNFPWSMKHESGNNLMPGRTKVSNILEILIKINVMAVDTLASIHKQDNGAKDKIIAYMKVEGTSLAKVVPENLRSENYEKIQRHISWGQEQDMNDLLYRDIPGFQSELINLLDVRLGLKNNSELLHPLIIEKALPQYDNGHYRDAVLNSIIAIFDFIREKTGLKEDGSDLIGRVFSLSKPILKLNRLETDSEQNEQKGFLQIYQGAYLGIRNPKAHTTNSDINQKEAMQYLVFASLLARRVEEADKVE